MARQRVVIKKDTKLVVHVGFRDESQECVREVDSEVLSADDSDVGLT